MLTLGWSDGHSFVPQQMELLTNHDRWIGLACTDTEITPDRVCRIYAKRWAIEVFFKQAKQ